jgi:hypothetical protein
LAERAAHKVRVAAAILHAAQQQGRAIFEARRG